MVAGVFVGFGLGFTCKCSSCAPPLRKLAVGRSEQGGADGRPALRAKDEAPRLVSDWEGALGLALISVAIGLGLAVAYQVAFVRYQLFMSKRSPMLATALSAAGFMLRLFVFAVVLVLLALFTELNIIALAVAFVVLYTILSGVSIQRYLAKAKRDKAARGAGPEGGIVGR